MDSASRSEQPAVDGHGPHPPASRTTPAPPSAVTFDFWNTLVVGPKGMLSDLRRAAVHRVLGDDSPVDPTELDRLLAEAVALHDAAWRRGTAFRPEDGAAAVVDAIPGLDRVRRADVVDAYLDAGADADLCLVPEAAATVTALASAGIPLGIVCDVGLTGSRHLRGFLDRQGLLDAFTGWAFSDEVGAFKPAPEIFRHVLTHLGGADPTNAVHVGDLRRTDIAGARAMGMRAVRFRGIDDDPAAGPEGDLVVDRLGALTPSRLAELLAAPAGA